MQTHKSLSSTQKRQAVQRVQNGESLEEVAQYFGVSPKSVKRWSRGEALGQRGSGEITEEAPPAPTNGTNGHVVPIVPDETIALTREQLRSIISMEDTALRQVLVAILQ